MTVLSDDSHSLPAERASSALWYLSGAPRLSTKPTTESLGPRSHILGVTRALRSHGYDVTEFIVGDSVPTALHGDGSEARMGSSLLSLAVTDLGRLFYRIKSRAGLRKALGAQAEKPPVVYERYSLMQELGRVAQKAGAYWILEVNALLAVEATSDRRATLSRRVATAFERRTLRGADLIIAVTDSLAKAIGDTYGIPAERILVIENGVDAAAHRPASPVGQDAPTIGFLGSLYNWQQVDVLLHAASRSSEPWRIRIAGTGPELTRLRELAESLLLEDRIEFLGRIHPDEVPGFLRTVDFCYAGHQSLNGAYFSPLKLWEYLAAGKPVIASRHEATERLSSQSYPVFVFDPSEESIDRVLGEAIANREQVLQLAATAQARTAHEHSWESRVSPLVRLLDNRVSAS